MELYRWQKECLCLWEQNHYRGIINVITGGGKTVLSIAAIRLLTEKHPDLKIKIVVPTIPLAQQWKLALVKAARDESEIPGFYGGQQKDSSERKILIYIVNSARTGLNRHIRADLAVGRHILLIVDECHRVCSRENRKMFDFLTPEKEESPFYCCLGLSATPFSSEEDALYLQRVLGRQIYEYGLSYALQEGVVTPFTLCQAGVSFSEEEYQNYASLSEQIRGVLGVLLDEHPWLKELSDQVFIKRVTALATLSDYDPEDPATQFLLLCYQRKEITVLARERIQCCIQLLKRLSVYDRILIFCERIEQAESAANAIRQQFGASTCAIYHSKMSAEARSRNMALFRNRAVRILISCRCLDEGIDVPDANIGIVLSCSSLTRQRIQRLGRIIRRSAEKDAGCLYYIFVRESNDNKAYLPGFDGCRLFDLQYDAKEHAFSNDLYEYAANDLLDKAGKKGLPRNTVEELRRCLLQGISRSDYLLDRDTLTRKIAKAVSRKEKNYWIAMQSIHEYFNNEGETGI